MTKKKECKRCRGRMQEKTVDFPYWNGMHLVAIVNGVPCLVCELCGEQVIEPAVETTLKFIVQDYVKMGKIFPIPSTPYRALRPHN